jgi:Heavy metal associated domain 2
MKKKQNKPKESSDFAEIVHRLPQRVRVRAPLIASHADACQRVAQRLLHTMDAAEKVSVNLFTGSITIESQQDLDADVLLEQIRSLVAEEVRQFPDVPSGPTKIAQSVARAFANLNDDVRGGLHHRADLAALLPIFLASMAVGQVVTTGRLPAPAWFNFCWWSFRAFLTFHKNAARKERETPNVSETTPGT